MKILCERKKKGGKNLFEICALNFETKLAKNPAKTAQKQQKNNKKKQQQQNSKNLPRKSNNTKKHFLVPFFGSFSGLFRGQKKPRKILSKNFVEFLKVFFRRVFFVGVGERGG